MMLLTYSMHVCFSRDRGPVVLADVETKKRKDAKRTPNFRNLSVGAMQECGSFQVSRPQRPSTKDTNCWNRVSGPEPRNHLTPEKLIGTPNSLEAQTLVTW